MGFFSSWHYFILILYLRKKAKNLRKAEHVELYFLFAQAHNWYLRIIVSLAALLSSYLLITSGFHYTDTLSLAKALVVYSCWVFNIDFIFNFSVASMYLAFYSVSVKRAALSVVCAVPTSENTGRQKLSYTYLC